MTSGPAIAAMYRQRAMVEVGADPVNVPATEVAWRKPRWVVRISPWSCGHPHVREGLFVPCDSTINRKSAACSERELVVVADRNDPPGRVNPSTNASVGNRAVIDLRNAAAD